MSQLRERGQTARAVPSPYTQRQHLRYAATEDQAWLGWWEGQVYQRSPATLVDISHGGAKVIAEVSPPRRSTIWICLDGPRRTEWVEAEIVEILRLRDNSAQVRMAFREICPYTFFEVAVFGHRESRMQTSSRGVMAAAVHRMGW